MVHNHLSKTGAQRAAAALLLGQEVVDLETSTFEGCDSCSRRVRLAGELIRSFLVSEARKKEILRGIRASVGPGSKDRLPRRIRDYLDLVT